MAQADQGAARCGPSPAPMASVSTCGCGVMAGAPGERARPAAGAALETPGASGQAGGGVGVGGCRGQEGTSVGGPGL